MVTVLFGGSRLCVVTVLFVVNRLCVVSFLFVVRRLCMVGSFFVVSRLALRWGAKRPQSSRRVSPGRTQWPVLGPLRSPAQGKPAHHKKVVFAIRYRLTAKSLFTSTNDPTRAG